MNDIADYDKEEAEIDADIAKMIAGDDVAIEALAGPATSENEVADSPVLPHNDPSTDAEDSSINSVEEEATDKQVKDAKRRMHEATTEAAEYRRQNAALQGQVELLQRQLADFTQSKPQEPLEPEIDLDSLGDEYPDTLAPLVKHNKILEKRLAEMNDKMAMFEQTAERVNMTEAEIAKERHFNAIKQAHPDLDGIVQDEGFLRWVQAQPSMIKQALVKGSTEDVIASLNFYKQSLGAQARPGNGSKLDEARKASSPNIQSVTTRPESQKRTFTRAEIAAMSLAEFQKNEEAIDAALASGNIA